MVCCGFYILHDHCRLMKHIMIDTLQYVPDRASSLLAGYDVSIVDVPFDPCMPLNKLSYNLKLAD